MTSPAAPSLSRELDVRCRSARSRPTGGCARRWRRAAFSRSSGRKTSRGSICTSATPPTAAMNSMRMRWRTSRPMTCSSSCSRVAEPRPHQPLGLSRVGERDAALQRLGEAAPAELERGVELMCAPRRDARALSSSSMRRAREAMNAAEARS